MKNLQLLMLVSVGIASCGSLPDDEHPTGVAGVTTALNDPAPSLPGRVANAAELARMRKYVDSRSAPGVVRETRTLHGPQQDEPIDCVDVHLQHGVDDPIDYFPSPPSAPVDRSGAAGAPADSDANRSIQGYGSIVDRCPDGTIPRRRVTLDELTRFESLEKYFGLSQPTLGPTDLHQYAKINSGDPNNGAESIINVWQPYVESTFYQEFSLSQIWVAGGNIPDNTRQTVEAGWHVYPAKYGDSLARLFIFFTTDNYHANSIYNLDQAGFTQVDPRFFLGGWMDASTTGGAQVEVKFTLQQDLQLNWWFAVDGISVGFWPHERFAASGILNGASRSQFGGEIINAHASGHHTSTNMGSGLFPSAGYGYVAYQRKIRRIVGTSGALLYDIVPLGAPQVTGPNCYDAATGFDTGAGQWGRYLYFGGPGYTTFWQNCD